MRSGFGDIVGGNLVIDATGRIIQLRRIVDRVPRRSARGRDSRAGVRDLVALRWQ